MKKVIIGAVATIIIVTEAAWMFRYAPMAGGQIWDRWRHRVCVTNFEMEPICSAADAASVAKTQTQRESAEEKADQQKIKSIWSNAENVGKSGGAEKIRKLRTAGIDEGQIAKYVNSLRQTLTSAGFSKQELDEYFGGDPYEGTK